VSIEKRAKITPTINDATRIPILIRLLGGFSSFFIQILLLSIENKERWPTLTADTYYREIFTNRDTS
jgi:hypothetical protein